MKTTVEIPDALLAEAKALAAREGTTLRTLIERGLRDLLHHRQEATAAALRDGSVDGNGLRPELRDGSWERIRGAIYEGRGG